MYAIEKFRECELECLLVTVHLFTKTENEENVSIQKKTQSWHEDE
jgi:hypothetical protein